MGWVSRLFGSLPQSCQSTSCISTLFGECNSFLQPGWSVSTMQRWQHTQALLWLSLFTVTSCLAPCSEPSFPRSSSPRPSSSKHSAKAQQYYMKDLTMLTIWSTPHATSTTSPGIVTWIRHTRADCFSRWDFVHYISHFSFSLLLNIPVAFAGTYTYESIIWKTQRKQDWAPQMLVHWAVKHSCSPLTEAQSFGKAVREASLADSTKTGPNLNVTQTGWGSAQAPQGLVSSLITKDRRDVKTQLCLRQFLLWC